jgi:hypothetical protein
MSVGPPRLVFRATGPVVLPPGRSKYNAMAQKDNVRSVAHAQKRDREVRSSESDHGCVSGCLISSPLTAAPWPTHVGVGWLREIAVISLATRLRRDGRSRRDLHQRDGPARPP